MNDNLTIKTRIMKLEHFFRLIIMSIFQKAVVYNKENYGQGMSYENQFFACPHIICKNGFTVSLQINNGNYCLSENGYRSMGVNWKELEFGFPNVNEKAMFRYSEMWDDSCNEKNFDVTSTVGSIPIEIMQKICDKHGGIDWDKTLSVKAAQTFLK